MENQKEIEELLEIGNARNAIEDLLNRFNNSAEALFSKHMAHSLTVPLAAFRTALVPYATAILKRFAELESDFKALNDEGGSNVPPQS
jgi:hypothetical protein